MYAHKSISYLLSHLMSAGKVLKDHLRIPREGRGETEAKEGETCPGLHRAWCRAQLQLHLRGLAEGFVVRVQVVLGPYGWSLHLEMMPLAQQGNLRE